MLTLAAEVKTASRHYPVQVGWECLDEVGRLVREHGFQGRVVMVSDQAVASLYERAVRGSLEAVGFPVLHYEVPSGEASKTLESAGRIYDFLVEHRIERSDLVVALGGGMIGDLAGFVAVTFLRGLSWAVLPTSLLAMTDASIGGKTGVNHPRAKNLIGAFHQPVLVLADVSTLSTLPERERTSGWAEVVKHGLTLDTALLDLLETHVEALRALDPKITMKTVALSAAAKAAVVSQDERESGLRRVLNYGHTIGHALEAATGYGRFLHGEAVAVGMMGAVRLSHRLGLVNELLVARQESLLAAFGLPTHCSGVDREVVGMAMELDKKSREGEVRWVLLTAAGKTTIRPVPSAEVAAVLEELVRP
ncbi:MAG: 3-dehydroquinate synthase [Dehalococcoidia bacterium]|nr:3-dehydroquinate synthase [Dehalococcoidia bacterium]